ncbi:MAG: thiol reductant ABC exporter subunit CydC [Rhizobiales bacterium]|nr:thiol reductant ABC exporter subunit CydC [Hyphomicrobiales bacterium]
MNAILSFRPLFRPHRRTFLTALLLATLTLAAGTALLGTSGWFITAAALSAAGVAFNIFGPSSLVRGFSLIRILARYGERVAGHQATLRFLSDLRAWLFERLFPRAPLSAAGLRHGDLVSRLVADVDALDSFFLVAVAPAVAVLAIGSIVAGLLALWLPVAVLLYVPLLAAAAFAIPIIAVRHLGASGRHAIEASAALRTAALDGIAGHRDFVVNGAGDRAIASVAEAARRLGRLRTDLGDTVVSAATIAQGLAGLCLVVTLCLGLDALHAGRLGGPTLVGLLLAVAASFEAAAMLVRGTARIGMGLAAADRLRAIAAMPPAVADPAMPVPLPTGSEVAFRDVSFAYAAGRPVLEGVSLEVAPGRRIAVTGASGSGKSTLVALLLRLADPTAGVVTVAGADLRTVRQADLHARVALLSQDAPVFMDTVRANLLVGRPDATDAGLWQALERARIADAIRALPGGLDAFLGEGGRTLSTGEGRRLCLARALLSDAAILVLDEPTGGLDHETEQAFLADLGAATAGRTVILVTHATLPAGAVDQAWRLDAGRLALMEETA